MFYHSRHRPPNNLRNLQFSESWIEKLLWWNFSFVAKNNIIKIAFDVDRYISCVNKLNSIEQQKNQLNFDMERQKINHEIKMVDAKLRKLCSIDDSRKTEAMRDEERLLNEK